MLFHKFGFFGASVAHVTLWRAQLVFLHQWAIGNACQQFKLCQLVHYVDVSLATGFPWETSKIFIRRTCFFLV